MTSERGVISDDPSSDGTSSPGTEMDRSSERSLTAMPDEVCSSDSPPNIARKRKVISDSTFPTQKRKVRFLERHLSVTPEETVSSRSSNSPPTEREDTPVAKLDKTSDIRRTTIRNQPPRRLKPIPEEWIYLPGQVDPKTANKRTRVRLQQEKEKRKKNKEEDDRNKKAIEDYMQAKMVSLYREDTRKVAAQMSEYTKVMNPTGPPHPPILWKKASPARDIPKASSQSPAMHEGHQKNPVDTNDRMSEVGISTTMAGYSATKEIWKRRGMMVELDKQMRSQAAEGVGKERAQAE